jgi:hypothetical protein
MTLVAFNATAESADLITDTWSYALSAQTLGHVSKVMAIPHLDTVVTTQGDGEAGIAWKLGIQRLAEDVPGFDELVTAAPKALHLLWTGRQVATNTRNRSTPGATYSLTPSVAFIIGYSASQERFRAVGFASDTDFEPFEVEGLHVMPSPFSMRPSDLELNRFVDAVSQDTRPGDAENLAVLRALPPRPAAPTTPLEWAALAMQARQDRSIDATVSTRLKVLVGGELWHTNVQRGAIFQARTLTFNDSGDELAAIMAGTLHPLGQQGPCPCWSGQRYMDCCLAKIADDPCLCGSRQALKACCSVRAERPALLPA